MEQSELERIVDEYCDSLRARLKENLPLFADNWNGLHVRALAHILTRDERDIIKKAEKVITTSSRFYQMKL